jgi:hypothetical protein
MSNLTDKVKGSLSFLDNQYVSGILMLIIVLYASLAAPQLPPNIAKIFDYNLTRLVISFLILYVSIKSVPIALILAIAFIISIQTLNRVSFEEQLRQWLFMSNARSNMPPQMDQMPSQIEQIPQIPIARPEFGPDSRQTMGDSGFEVDSTPSGCYGATTGLQGYDGDKLSEY